MTNLVEFIASKNFDEANSIVEEKFELIMRSKLLEMKKIIAAKSVDEQNLPMNKRYPNEASKVRADIKEEDLEEKRGLWDNIHAKRERIKRGSGERMRKPGSEGAPSEKDLKNSQTEEALEEDQLDEARFKIVKARIRGGKIQRRRKVSNVPGMTFRGGKLTRMSPTERRRRKMGARRGKIKRKAKMSRALMKRKRSMMKRRSMGLR